ncbi:MAG: phage major capsid protein [Rickettsiales bacterium]|jgi:HK97 family phage major capsid protein|nr:phage major capsid protein [Rickettsiales bacterium]
MELEQKINKIEEKVDFINNTWEHFKEVNNDRLSEIERKGSPDPLTEIKLDTINNILNQLEEQKSKISVLEIAASRPQNATNAPEFKKEDHEYKSAFNNYLRKGIDSELFNLEQKRDLGTNLAESSSYGGFLLLPSIQKMLLDNIEERCVMRKICSVQEISSSALDVLSASNMIPSWLSETGTVSDTDTSIFSKKTIGTFDLVAQPRVTQKLIDDSAINLEEWLANRLADDFIGAEENAFINGLGNANNQPTGILKYIGTTPGIDVITSDGSTSLVTENDILSLYYSLEDKYLNNASFLMSRTAVKEIRMLKDSTSGNYLWNPALLAGQQSSLLGCPVYTNAYIPVLTDSSTSIIFGDFKYYQIVDRVGIRILRDPFTAKPYVRFYTTKRVGGDVIDTNAFKILESADL